MRASLSAALLTAAFSGMVAAKLPPLSDEAKAKAAEAAAKAAHGNKVADFQLCKSMNRVAERYAADAKKSGKTVTPTTTPDCADPGPFVYTPPGAAPAAAPAAAAPASAPKPPAPKA